MTDKSVEAIQRELVQLRSRMAQLEEEVAIAESHTDRAWTRRYYLAYYATTGFFLGMIAAIVSLLVNVVGALIVGQHPLQLIRVYLTFGLGRKALDLQLNEGDAGLMLVIGCCLYIATGMLLGTVIQAVISRLAEHAGLMRRLAIATVLGLVIWVVNYYLLLSWIQPLLFGGNWIVTEIPVPVAALTHLVFAWTMAVLYPLGVYTPYRVTTE